MSKITFNGPPPGSEGGVFLTCNVAENHTLILGRSSRGRSGLIKELIAASVVAGTPVRVIEIEPTEEDLRFRVERERMEQEKKAMRLAAVRDAYWLATDPDSGEWSSLHDSLSAIGLVDSSLAQCRTLFDCLPGELIGRGIAWSFTDTEVRDDILEYLRDNRDFILATLAAHEGKD